MKGSGHHWNYIPNINSGWMIDPPADNAYAVDPVGVATIKPSERCS